MNRLLCYAHFDENGAVAPYVRHTLAAMKQSCQEILFVSNSPLCEKDLLELRSSCRAVIVNQNSGYDFFMWRTALEAIDYSEFDEVVLMNSSVYGPIGPIDSMFSAMAGRGSDFWGITECFQRQPHIQSYFLVFTRKVITSAVFAAFWKSVLPYKNKLQVIMSYEIGLTLWLTESGFTKGVYRSFADVAALCGNSQRIGKNDNVTLKHPEILLRSGSPFLKKELIRKNSFDLQAFAPYFAEHYYPQELFEIRASGQNSPVCPLCNATGRRERKGVRNYTDMHDTGRYDYYRCGNKDCRILWLPGESTALEGVAGNLSLLEILATAKAGESIELELPHADALGLKLFRTYWFALSAPYNKVFYTRNAICALLDKAGFTVADISTSTLHATNLSHSLDIAVHKWTSPECTFGAGMKFLAQLLYGLCRLVTVTTGNQGDVCRIRAIRKA